MICWWTQGAVWRWKWLHALLAWIVSQFETTTIDSLAVVHHSAVNGAAQAMFTGNFMFPVVVYHPAHALWLPLSSPGFFHWGAKWIGQETTENPPGSAAQSQRHGHALSGSAWFDSHAAGHRNQSHGQIEDTARRSLRRPNRCRRYVQQHVSHHFRSPRIGDAFRPGLRSPGNSRSGGSKSQTNPPVVTNRKSFLAVEWNGGHDIDIKSSPTIPPSSGSSSVESAVFADIHVPTATTTAAAATLTGTDVPVYAHVPTVVADRWPSVAAGFAQSSRRSYSGCHALFADPIHVYGQRFRDLSYARLDAHCEFFKRTLGFL